MADRIEPPESEVFSRLKVLDLSHAMAGPFCGMILADLGAQVIRLEHPEGDHFRPLLGGAYHVAINRNKRNLSLDLKHPSAVEAVKKLIAGSDILIESFIPGTLERLGLGYQVARAINPALIYCSVSGFGQTGPYSSLPGYDVVAQALCGIMTCTGEKDGPPVRVGSSWIDAGTGVFAALAVLKALLERQATGQGQHLDLSLMDTALSFMSPLITRYSMCGEVPARAGSALAVFAPYQNYAVKGGYVFIGASMDRFWELLCQQLGLDHLLADPRFASNVLRVEHRDELNQILEPALASWERDQLVEGLRDKGVPCAPVLDVGQILRDPRAMARGLMHHWVHPQVGPVTQVKTPIAVDGRMPSIRTPSAPVGQHTRAILAELGYSPQEIKEMLATGAAVADQQ